MRKSLRVLAGRLGLCDRLIRGAALISACIFLRALFTFSCVAFEVDTLSFSRACEQHAYTGLGGFDFFFGDTQLFRYSMEWNN